MADQDSHSPVERFIIEQIDTVPHLEALLLIWNGRPRKWSAGEMAAALYVEPDVAERVLRQLVERDLILQASDESGQYYCEANSDRDALLQKVNETYRRQLVRISRLIHSKASVAVHDFARAFRFKKD
ncbi:MAG TPA: hypothetical protein VMU28_00430 [Terriglobales bacterium]|nr:hypothetical protein [Terriglobales bacterium]